GAARDSDARPMSDQTLASQPAPTPTAESFATPGEYLAEGRASQLHTSLSEQWVQEAGEALGGGMRSLLHGAGYLAADQGWTPVTSMDDPRLREPWGPSEPATQLP